MWSFNGLINVLAKKESLKLQGIINTRTHSVNSAQQSFVRISLLYKVRLG